MSGFSTGNLMKFYSPGVILSKQSVAFSTARAINVAGFPEFKNMYHFIALALGDQRAIMAKLPTDVPASRAIIAANMYPSVRLITVIVRFFGPVKSSLSTHR
jgi:hypothetical protein